MDINIAGMITTNPLIFIISVGIVGCIVGSFLNVVIYRLPIILKNEYKKDCFEYFHQMSPAESCKFNLITPHSHCPNCKTPISWWQNIPIIGYIMLGGKCAYCKTHIPWRYIVVEILSCITTVFVVVYFGAGVKTLPMLILTWTLIAAIFIDFEHQLLPDYITIPLIWVGLVTNVSYTFVSPSSAIIGAISGYLSLWIIARVFKHVRKVDGMGYGDFKLFAAFGAWLGWQMLPIIILVASLAGVIVGIILVISKKLKFSEPLSFGPYIAIAGWLACFWGPQVLNLLGHSN